MGRLRCKRASERGHVELAQVLLEHDAVATVQDSDGWTPLYFVSSTGHVEPEQVLRQRGSIVIAQDRCVESVRALSPAPDQLHRSARAHQARARLPLSSRVTSEVSTLTSATPPTSPRARARRCRLVLGPFGFFNLGLFLYVFFLLLLPILYRRFLST
jgi:hypothetical protein